MAYKVLTHYDKERFNPMVCCIKEGGLTAERLKGEGFRVEILGRMQGKRFDMAVIRDLYKLIKKENIHVLRTHQYHAGLYGRIAGALAGVPVIIPSFHNLYTMRRKIKPSRGYINRLLGRFSNKIVAVSGAVAADIVRFDGIGRDKIVVVHNGTMLEEFDIPLSRQQARKRLNLPLDSTIIGTVGRLSAAKGQRFLIEACSELNNPVLAIAGDGSVREQLERVAAEKNVRCVFMGMMPPEDIPIFLKALDIYCFPSLWEGLPSALVEAMAAGLPIIASDIAPHREVMADAGIFVPAKDPAALAAEIERLMADEGLKMSLGERALQRAEHFSIENIVAFYERIFEAELAKANLT